MLYRYFSRRGMKIKKSFYLIDEKVRLKELCIQNPPVILLQCTCVSNQK